MLFFQQIAPYLPLQLSVALFLVEIRWPVAHFIFSLYSKFVDMTINITSDNKDTETISAFRFRLYLVAFGLPYLLVELFYIGIPVVRTDGRAYDHVITKISRMGRLPNFLTHGAPLRAWSSAIIIIFKLKGSAHWSVSNGGRLNE